MSDRAAPSGQGDAVTRVEHTLGRLLRLGVMASLLVMLAGIGVTIAAHPAYLDDSGELAPLMAGKTEFPHTFGQLWRGLLSGDGPAIVTVGLVLLILLPIVRVVSSDVLFIRRRDWAFTVLTSVVLVVLLASFLLGKAA